MKLILLFLPFLLVAVDEQLLTRLELDEGFRSHAYVCPTGYLTIGYGHRILPGESFDAGITEADAERLLANDVARAADAVRVLVLPGTQPQARHVLVCMAFQCGVRGLRGFTRTLALVNAGDYAGAADEMLDSKWARQTPQRAQRLAQMMRECK